MKHVKLNKYSRTIDSEVDLHGLTALEAERELYLFIRAALRDGDRLVRIITGKGLHSPDGRAVVREIACEVLQGLDIRFREGKPAEGGSGVIIAELIN